MIYAVLCIVIIYSSLLMLKINKTMRAINATAQSSKPFNRDIKGSSLHILVMGDSSMYSAGVTNPVNTVGGLLAAEYPNASIETTAVIGAKVKDLPIQLNKAQHSKYNLIVVGIGGNDIVKFSRYSEVTELLSAFLKQTSQIADQVILCHSVNIGNIGFFVFPLNYLYSHRSLRMSRLYTSIASKYPKVSEAIFYRPLNNDHYNKKTRHKFVAADGFHGTDYANQYFFKLVLEAIQKGSYPNNKLI